MSIAKPEFAYACRRSRDELVRAINAKNEAAATSHRQLSILHAMRAVTIMLRTGPATDGGDRPLGHC